jgi:diguanylate cyclase (GGDEF)-like protein
MEDLHQNQIFRKIDAENAKAYQLRQLSPETALVLAENCLSKSEERNYRRGIAESLRTISIIRFNYDIDQSYDLCISAIEIFKELNDEFGESSALVMLSLHYHHRGWYQAASQVLIDGLAKARKSGNTQVEGLCQYNLGVNAQYRLDYVSAIQYYDIAHQAAKETGNTIIQAVTLSSKGECLLQLERLDELESSEFYELQVEGLVRLGANGAACDVFNFLSQKAIRLKNYRKALGYTRQGIRLAKQRNITHKEIDFLALRGRAFTLNRNLKRAEKSLRRAIFLARSLGNHRQLSDCLGWLGECLRAIDDENPAYDAQREALQIQSELFDRNRESRTLELEALHKLTQYEDAANELKQENRQLAEMNERLENALRERMRLQTELERLALTDELTGALNRRRILAIGKEMVSRYCLHQRDGVIMIADIDHFKSVNDTFGHNTGDEVLRRFAASCRSVLRPTDSFGRLGGEEFCILLDRTSEDVAAKVAQRILEAIRSIDVSDIMPGRRITASLGIAPLSGDHLNIESALHDADLALYEAKRTGRDRGLFATAIKRSKAA